MQAERGYVEVKTPQIYDAELWETSGHWDKYRENMFVTRVRGPRVRRQADELPGPLRTCSGCSAGPIATCRTATPSRACCTATSRAARCTGCCACATSPRTTPTSSAPRSRSRTRSPRCLDFAFDVYELFGFAAALELSTRPDERIGDDALWDHAEAALEQALRDRGLDYAVNAGDGAFYGPKIDLHMTDSLGRSWQLGTVQLDYEMPARFGLTYTGADNAEHAPVMIHRALFGSFERFIGILLEHYAGELPVWLTPVQAIVLPIADRHAEAAGAAAARAASARACASSSTSAPSRSGARSATPSCARSRTCSSSATARPRTARSRVRAPSRGRPRQRAPSTAVAERVCRDVADGVIDRGYTRPR